MIDLYVENLDFLSFYAGYKLSDKDYKKLSRKSKEHFKNIMRNFVIENENLDKEPSIFLSRAVLIDFFMDASKIDKNYKDMLFANKLMTKFLENEDPKEREYYYVYQSYIALAQFQFDKNDWLGAIENYKLAIKYLREQEQIYGDDYADSTEAWILRNLFAAKWNHKENGDKMGACEDLRLASTLDADYYNYYVKNCAN